MGRGLSEQQKRVLTYITEREAAGYLATRAGMLRHLYGMVTIWKPEYEDKSLERSGGQNFRTEDNPTMAKASASLSRTLRRLVERGLLAYGYGFPPGITERPKEPPFVCEQWAYRLTSGQYRTKLTDSDYRAMVQTGRELLSGISAQDRAQLTDSDVGGDR